MMASVVGKRVDGVEERLLVLLIVLVVRERLAFHQREQRDEVAVHPPGLAAREFRHVGILLLRHDRRSGAEAVGQRDEGEARIRPHVSSSANRDRCVITNAAAAVEFDGEIAIGHGVERVAAECFEPEFRATRSRSIGKPVPASAALPNGSRFTRRRQSRNRSASRANIAS